MCCYHCKTLTSYLASSRSPLLNTNFSHPSQNSSGITHCHLLLLHSTIIIINTSSLPAARPGHVVARRISCPSARSSKIRSCRHRQCSEGSSPPRRPRARYLDTTRYTQRLRACCRCDGPGTSVNTLTGVLEELYHGHAPIHL